MVVKRISAFISQNVVSFPSPRMSEIGKIPCSHHFRKEVLGIINLRASIGIAIVSCLYALSSHLQ